MPRADEVILDHTKPLPLYRGAISVSNTIEVELRLKWLEVARIITPISSANSPDEIKRGLIQMESKAKHSRRKVLKTGMTALAVVPFVGLSERAFATQNTAIRTALKYQLMANGEKSCKVCVNFIPNKDKPNNDADVNGCKLYPGDTEICPHCYCNGFVQNPAATKAGASFSPWS